VTTTARTAVISEPVVKQVYAVLATVADPEIPVLSVVDLGIIRSVAIAGERGVRIGVSPTYSGCPATRVIGRDIQLALARAGFSPVVVEEVLAPAWTSDWISPAGRDKLRQYGIAPPSAVMNRAELAHGSGSITCPRCGSADTELLSEFGSTPCKALHRCRECLEPFDCFKCI
jgi:ring-1,2-phenylacetyl-CoA epoxidase subunit PaaD